MKRWHVYNGHQLIRAIDSEHAFVRPDGRLSFYNGRGHYSQNVAGFVAGSWTYYLNVGDIAEKVA